MAANGYAVFLSRRKLSAWPKAENFFILATTEGAKGLDDIKIAVYKPIFFKKLRSHLH